MAALPVEFVPLAEETGLIVPLGDIVLHLACEQVAKWRGMYPSLANLQVAVNVSSAQLRSHDAVDRMATIVDLTGLPTEALILEMTETVLMDERTGAAGKLAALRSLGVRLAVDDFGTGYSSLLYLRRFPLDMLKIDRSFVAGLVDSPEDATIVDAVVRLGHSFGLQVPVAEGVETAEQLRLLRSLGCDMGQGHFWARPLPPETLLSQLLADGPSPYVDLRPGVASCKRYPKGRAGRGAATVSVMLKKLLVPRPHRRRRLPRRQEAAGCSEAGRRCRSGRRLGTGRRHRSDWLSWRRG